MLTPRSLGRATLARQGLLEALPAGSVRALVERVGSLQAQHPDWPPFALQSRMPADASPVDLLRARRRKSVVRASAMRMTVHVVSAADYWSMVTLAQPFRLDQWRLLFKADPVTSPLARRIASGHPAVLAEMRNRPLAIREIEDILATEAGRRTPIPPNRPLWRHFSATIPLIHVPSDQEAYGRSRYLPAEWWLGPPSPEETDPERAARHLAHRYLGAFGPASIEDLVAYVGRGRNVGRWRAVVAGMADDLTAFVDEQGRALVDLPQAPRPGPDAPAPPRLLARWDSLLLAHEPRHRDRVLPPEHQATVITRNADVLPTFLVDGVVAGTWLPRRAEDGRPALDLRPFGRLSNGDRDGLEAEGDRLLPLLGPGAFSRYPGTD